MPDPKRDDLQFPFMPPLWGGYSTMWSGASVPTPQQQNAAMETLYRNGRPFNTNVFMPPPMPTLPSYAGAAAPLFTPPAFGPLATGYVVNPAFANNRPNTPQGQTPTNPLAPFQNTWNDLEQWQEKMMKNPLFNPANTVPTGKGTTKAQVETQTGTTSQAQAETWVDPNGNKRHKDPKIDYSYRRLDGELGQGFTDQFIARMGKDPISWYADQYKARYPGWDLPDARGDDAREKLMGFAAYAAESDARMLPNAVAEWQQKHGNTPIPQSQWETWSRIALSTGGDGLNAGVGESRYSVY